MLEGRWLLPDGLCAEHPIVTALLIAPGIADALAQDTQGHGPPIFFNKTDRSFNAGPSFMFNEFTRWSSVRSGNPEPSMHWSRKFWNNKKHLKIKLLLNQFIITK